MVIVILKKMRMMMRATMMIDVIDVTPQHFQPPPSKKRKVPS
jgi:hypothetical protein